MNGTLLPKYFMRYLAGFNICWSRRRIDPSRDRCTVKVLTGTANSLDHTLYYRSYSIHERSRWQFQLCFQHRLCDSSAWCQWTWNHQYYTLKVSSSSSLLLFRSTVKDRFIVRFSIVFYWLRFNSEIFTNENISFHSGFRIISFILAIIAVTSWKIASTAVERLLPEATSRW